MSLNGLLSDCVNHVKKKSYSHFPEDLEESLDEPDHSKTDWGLTKSCHLARDGMYTSLGTDEHQTHGLDPVLPVPNVIFTLTDWMPQDGFIPDMPPWNWVGHVWFTNANLTNLWWNIKKRRRKSSAANLRMNYSPMGSSARSSRPADFKNLLLRS